MAQIRRTAAGPRVRLTADEVRLFGKLADEIDLLLRSDAEPAGLDDAEATGAGSSSSGEFSALDGLDWPTPEAIEAPEDPALRRLLPDAYRDDDEAAAEFRRYTDATLRGGKRADVAVVRQCLASIGAKGERVLDNDQAEAWLRFVTDARLVLASRLGIETAADAEALADVDVEDPRFMAYAVYEWLVSVLGGLLGVIHV